MTKNNIDIRLRIIEENQAAIRRVTAGLNKIKDVQQLSAAAGVKVAREEKVNLVQRRIAAREETARHKLTIANIKKEIAAERDAFRARSGNLRQIQGIVMGLGFNLLFTGMAIQRLAEGGLRALLTTYAAVVGETSEFAILTNRLAASWEYLKYTIVDALMQSGVFQTFIGWLQTIVNWFTDLSPAAKTGIGVALVGLVILGAIAQPVGMALLAISTYIAAMAFAPVFMTSLTLIVGWVLLLAAYFGVVYAIAKSDKWSGLAKFIGIIATAMMGAAAASWLLGFGLSWPLLLFGALILAALLFKEELGIAFSHIVDGLVIIGTAITTYLIDKLLWAINLWNMLAGVLGFGKINTSFLEGFKTFVIDKAGSILEYSASRRDQLRGQMGSSEGIMGGMGLALPEMPSVAQEVVNGSSNATTNNNGGAVNISIQNYNAQTGDAISSALDQMNSSLGGTPYGN